MLREQVLSSGVFLASLRAERWHFGEQQTIALGKSSRPKRSGSRPEAKPFPISLIADVLVASRLRTLVSWPTRLRPLHLVPV